jgi:GxxExxY protein
MLNNFDVNEYPLQEETGMIIKCGYEIHKHLGAGFLEIVYKNAFEYEFELNNIPYQREEEYSVVYKGKMLRHKFFADFIIFDNIILEIKAKDGGITEEDYAQSINYPKVSGCKVGLILNFSKLKMEIRRVIY